MAARNMRADYSPEVREAIAAGALTYKELNGLYCRFAIDKRILDEKQ